MSLPFLRAAALRSPLRSGVLRQRLYQLRLQSSNASDKTPPAKANPAPGGAATPGTAAANAVSIWQRLGPVTRAVEAYGRSQRKRPYTTQLVGAFFVCTSAPTSVPSTLAAASTIPRGRAGRCSLGSSPRYRNSNGMISPNPRHGTCSRPAR